ncbi:glycoside hydrolase superfamily [Echria macrotheca]|uniref:cellulase n=1 Tax=Echria macrotheca TaxID=438768 RepID=A0AAJ0B7B6_9PEZI|nr:glycoside hydrolase superfamily [Echria macrotheca]
MIKSLVFLGAAGLAAARVQFLGVSIAGGDFGCTIDGTCSLSSTQIPLKSLGGGDGEGQMKFFAQSNMYNMFRLPIAWQFLTATAGGPINETNLAKYDQLVQACLATGATCLIDIHNYARFNGKIVGQSAGGPTDDDLASLWTALATKYATNDKIAFELMNEPHDLDIKLWAATCQKVVTAIRKATNGKNTQIILLSGINFASAGDLVKTGSGEALVAIKNPDGTIENLMIALHKYLDADNSGTHADCVTNNTAAFGEAAAFLRAAKRQAIVSETGAAPNNTGCLAHFCEQNAFINANSDVFAGLLTWGAGSFGTDYLLSETPFFEGGKFINQPLTQQCVVGTFMASTAGVSSLMEVTTTPMEVTKDGASTVVVSAWLMLLPALLAYLVL